MNMKKPYRATSSDKQAGGNKFGKESFWERGSGGKNFAPTKLFKATCGECRKQCEVPFKPTGTRPVLCNDCFKRGDAGAYERPVARPGRSNGFEKRSYSKEPEHRVNVDSGAMNEQFKMLNDKLDLILKKLK